MPLLYHHRRRRQSNPNPGPGPDPDDDDDPTASNLVNMYFLILALFAVLLVCTLWYWRRSKRKEALVSLGVRQTALVADLEMRRRRGDAGGGGVGVGDREEERGVSIAVPPPVH